MYDHHGDQDNFKPGDGNTEFSGRQVLVHLANGDHEAYAKAGVYDRPMGTHDYCKENAYRFDQRAGTVEIYLWNGSDFSPVPPGATANFKDPAWLGYRGRWGNQRARRPRRTSRQARVGPRGTVPPRRICAPASAKLVPVRPPAAMMRIVAGRRLAADGAKRELTSAAIASARRKSDTAARDWRRPERYALSSAEWDFPQRWAPLERTVLCAPAPASRRSSSPMACVSAPGRSRSPRSRRSSASPLRACRSCFSPRAWAGSPPCRSRACCRQGSGAPGERSESRDR